MSSITLHLKIYTKLIPSLGLFFVGIVQAEGGSRDEEICSQLGLGGTLGACDGPDRHTCT